MEAGFFGVLAPIIVGRVARKIAGDRKLLPRSAVDNVHMIWWCGDLVTGVTAMTAAPRIVADVVADWDTKEHVARKVSLLPEKVGVFRQRNRPIPRSEHLKEVSLDYLDS